MAPRKKKQITDTLASFTGSAAASLMAGANQYRDGPFVGLDGRNNGFGWLYDTSWLCRAAVEMIPEDCFKRGYSWVADGPQVSLLDDEERRHQIRKKKRLALEYSRRYGEAYIYFDTGQSPSEPMNLDAVKRGGLRFVNVLRNIDMSPGEFENDPMSPYFNQPKYYNIGTLQVHPSRFCRFINGENPDTHRGISVLSYMLAPILAADTARDNTVALTTEALIDVMKVKGLMDAVQDPQLEAQLVRRYELFRQMKATNRLGVIDMDTEDFDRHPSQFTTLPDVIETMRREVSAAIEVPYSRLFGISGGLGSNGSSDQRAYYDSIATMQKNEIQPACYLLDECTIRSALGSRPPEIYIEWQSLYEMTDKERAEVANINADAVSKGVAAGVVPASMMTESLVNAWVEAGSFPGVEQSYAEFIAAGGWESEQPEEQDVIRPNEEEIAAQDSILDMAHEILNG